MSTLTFETTLPAPIDIIWAYHQNVAAALPELSPPDARVKIESADLPLRAGSRVIITARGPLGRPVRWTARYTHFRPPAPVVFGAEARWTDVQDTGPFKSFQHHHEFESVDSKTTRCVDHLTYRVGYGPLGPLADLLIVRPALRRIFAHRHRVLRDKFTSLPPTSPFPTSPPP